MPRYNDLNCDLTGEYIDLHGPCPLVISLAVSLPTEAARVGIEVLSAEELEARERVGAAPAIPFVVPNPALSPLYNRIVVLRRPVLELTSTSAARLVAVQDDRELDRLFACVKAQRAEEWPGMTERDCDDALTAADRDELLLDPRERAAVEARREAAAREALLESGRLVVEGSPAPDPVGERAQKLNSR